MANDIIDIDVFQTVENVEITVEPNLTTVNITQINAGNGSVPVGGTVGQVLAKIDSANFNTEWVNQSGGGGGGIPDAPNNANAYVRSGLAWVIGYTKTAIDNLISSSLVGYATQSWVNSQGFITNVISALGFTPYNATNPSGYQTAGQVQTIADAKINNDPYSVDWQSDQNGATKDVLFEQFEVLQGQLYNKQPLSAVLTATTASFTTADETKLDGIATGANVGVVPNTAITGATKTKITYDAKGLVTAGADATTADLSDFNSATRSQTEAELVAGANITITPSGTGATRQLTIASSGGGGGATPQTGQIIVTSGTSFTTPTTGVDTNTVYNIELIGGGGGGGALTTTNSSGSGGGGGGYCFVRLTGLNPNTSYVCQIGQGGATATAGGNTILTISGDLYFNAGGGGAGVNAVSSAGGAGAAGGNGDINITGQSGEDSTTASAAVSSSAGGSSPKGWGLGGSGVRNTLAGKAGTGYGGGGGAGKQNTTGGSGTSGIIFCQWYN